jgi:virulence factor Mce-like protein
MELLKHPAVRAILGAALIAALISTAVLVYASFSGAFSSDVALTAAVSQAGDALETNDIVTYRDTIIGTVTSTAADAQGGAIVGLRIHRDVAGQIPTSVRAVAVPSSLFGITQISLIPGSSTSGPGLASGDRIQADTSGNAQGLQSALADAYTLLTHVHPAQLDAALTGLATGLRGQGASMGATITRSDALLRSLAPSMPRFANVLDNFATVTGELAKNAPSLLASIGNSLTVGKTIIASRQALTTLFAVAPTTINEVNGLLNPTNVQNFVTVVRDERPVLAALAANPQALSKTISGFRSFADTFATVAGSGPYLRGRLVLAGGNTADTVPVAVGARGEFNQAISDPPQYTPAQCPRYPGADGQDCGSSGQQSGSRSSSDTSTGTGYGGGVSSIGSPREIAAMRTAVSAVTGVPAKDIPAATDLLFGPFLRGQVTVIQ